MARVARISIAPVKALGLVHPESVVLGPRGVAGNRGFDGDDGLYFFRPCLRNRKPEAARLAVK